MNRPAPSVVTTTEEPESLLPGDMRPVERMQRAIRHPSERFRREARQVKREKVAVRLANAAAHLVARMPRPLRDKAVDLVGAIWIRSTPHYRENVMANIGQVVGPEVSRAELEQIAKRVFRLSADNFAELLRVRVTPSSRVVAQVPSVASDLDIFRAARATGKGVVVVTGHIGAFDLVGMAIGASGVPLTVITGRTTSRMLFDAVLWLRQGHGVRVVEPTPSGVKDVIKALRRGEVAGFVSDYDFFHNGVPVTLFGRETTLPPGAIRIARDTGSIVVPMFAYRENGKHRLRVVESFSVPRTHDVDADVAGGMAMLTSRLEEGIRANPDQWVLFQRAWPSEPGAHSPAAPGGADPASEPLERVEATGLPPRESSA